MDAAMSNRDAGNPGSPETTPGATGVAELDSRVTAMLEEVAPDPSRSESSDEPADEGALAGERTTDAATSQELEQRVEAALTQAQQALREMTVLGEPRADPEARGAVHDGPSSTPDQINRPEAVPADIRTLDQQLSSTAERAIESDLSDFGDAVSVLGPSRTPDAPATEASDPAVPPTGVPHGVAGGMDARRGPEPATPSTAVAEPTPVLSSAAKTTAPSGEPAQHVQPARPPANEPGDRARETREKPAPSASSASVEPRPSAVSAVVTMALTPVMRSVEPLAARLASLSPGARQTISWLALLTAFNAGVTWVYVLTRGTPDSAATVERQPTIVGAPAAPQGHAQPAEGEGKPSAGRREIHGSR